MALCGALSPAELAEIAAIAELRGVGAGCELFREGDAGDGLFLVVSGDVDVVKRGPAGEQSLARLGAGGVLGEMSLVTSDARSATGRTLTEAQVLHLPAARFRALLDGGSIAAHKIVAAIAGVLARRLATMNGVVLGFAGGQVTPSLMKTQDLAALHRKMQVWSF